MSSHTYNVIGQTAIVEDGDRKIRRLYPAMNRVEMEQKRVEAIRDGSPITSWTSQTKTGNRILGCDEWGFVLETKAPRVKMVTCPVCNGAGHNGKYHCPVCDGSGICRPGNEKRWQLWQIEHMKESQLQPA